MDNKRIEQMFPTRAPQGLIEQKVEAARAAARGLAYTINAEMPDGSIKENALSRLRESVMWAVEGIATQRRD